jgi:hypothetical protein
VDLVKVLSELRYRRTQISEAIEALERVEVLHRRGPGRPPKSSSRREQRQTPSGGGVNSSLPKEVLRAMAAGRNEPSPS